MGDKLFSDSSTRGQEAGSWTTYKQAIGDNECLPRDRIHKLNPESKWHSPSGRSVLSAHTEASERRENRICLEK